MMHVAALVRLPVWLPREVPWIPSPIAPPIIEARIRLSKLITPTGHDVGQQYGALDRFYTQLMAEFAFCLDLA